MKKKLAIAFCVILIFSGWCEFFVLGGVLGLNGYRIKGIKLTAVCSLFVAVMAARKAKEGYVLSSVLTILGYSYTAYNVYITLAKAKELGNILVTFKLGFYLWALSFILLIIDLFLKFENKKEVPVEGNNILNNMVNNAGIGNMNNANNINNGMTNTMNTSIGNNIGGNTGMNMNSANDNTGMNNNVSINGSTDNTDVGNYVLGTYIFGVNGYESAADKACALINDVNNRLLSLYTINADNTGTVKLDFSYDSVIEVKSKKKIIMNEVTVQKKDHTVENQLLGVALLGGPLGAIVGSSKVFNDNSVNTKVNYNSLYELSVEYRTEKGSKILMIYCNEEPSEFVNKVNSSLGR